MLIGLVGRIGTNGLDFGMGEDYHSERPNSNRSINQMG